MHEELYSSTGRKYVIKFMPVLIYCEAPQQNSYPNDITIIEILYISIGAIQNIVLNNNSSPTMHHALLYRLGADCNDAFLGMFQQY